MNSNIKKFYKLFITSFLFIMFCPEVFANTSFVATVDKTKTTLDDSINLSLTASGGTPTDPEIPDTKGLEFVPRGTSSQMQITNGSFSSTQTYNFQINPKATGKLVIPPISTEIDGKKYFTQPINIEIIESEQRKDIDTSKNTFVSVHISNKNPYINEQVIYTFKFYTKIQTELNEIKYPDFKNFWVEDINKKNVYEQVINGERYQILETNKAIYPNKSGEIVISPLNFFVEILYQDDSMGGIFSTTRKEVENFKTQALKLNVKDLPKAPNNFSGIVGHSLKIDSNIDNQVIKSGDSANLEIKIQGIGNIADLKKFPLDIENIKIYEDKSIENSNLEDNKLILDKKFKYALIPLKKGQIIIPETSIIYFNTKSKKYESVKSKGFKLFSESAEESLKNIQNQNKSNNESKIEEDNIEPILENEEIKSQSIDKSIIWFIFILFLISIIILVYIYNFLGKIDLSKLNNKKNNSKLIKKIHSENSVDNMSKLLKEYLNYKYNINDFSEDSIKSNIKDNSISKQLIDLINEYNYLKFSGISNKSKEQEIIINTKTIIEKIK